MFQVQRSYYDSTEDHGLWSPSTSSSNFCEQDYLVSFHIAEFINTLSNLAYVYYAVVRVPGVALPRGDGGNGTNAGILRKHGSRGRVIWDVHTFSLLAVGLTSALFHASMRAVPQWLDESSMYLLAGGFIYTLLTTGYTTEVPSNITSPGRPSRISGKDSPEVSTTQPKQVIKQQNRISTTVGLMCVLTTTSYISHLTGDLTIHSVTFGIALALSGVKLVYLVFTFDNDINSNNNNGINGINGNNNQPQKDQKKSISKTKLLGLLEVTPTQRVLILQFVKAIGYLELAFALWLVDCNPTVCAWLRWVRNDVLASQFGSVGRFLGFFTELHGWWHVLTAKAAGEYIGLVRVLTTPVGQ